MAEAYESARAAGNPYYLDADDITDLTDWYATHDNMVKAFEAAEYGLMLHPDNMPLLVEYTYLYMDNHDTEKARQLIATFPVENDETIIVKAKLELLTDQAEKAETLIDSVARKDDLHNISDIAYAYLDTGHYEKALQWVEPAIERYPDDEICLGVAADSYYGVENLEQAIRCYNRLIDINPYSAPYWYGLARCYFDEEKYDQAIDACNYALIGDDEYADAYLIKGHAFYELENEEAAIESYRRAEELHAINPEHVHLYIALNRFERRHWEGAYNEFEVLIKITPHTFTSGAARIYAYAALCLYKTGNKQKAQTYLKKARQINPHESAIYLTQGRIRVEEGRYKMGAQAWSKAIEYDPTDIKAWNEISNHCIDLLDLNSAAFALRQCAEIDPNNSVTHGKLAVIYAIQGQQARYQEENRLARRPVNNQEIERLRNSAAELPQEEFAEALRKLLRTVG
jgi:tetratricopeptide (TPR) repeat protein